jgi:hypothetical protein
MSQIVNIFFFFRRLASGFVLLFLVVLKGTDECSGVS